MSVLSLALISIAMSVAAQFSLKHAMSSAPVRAVLSESIGMKSIWVLVSTPSLLLGFALYGMGAVVWLAVLARWDVSKAYPLVGLGFVMTAVVGWWIGENMSPMRAGGVALICIGVWLVGRSH